MRLFYEQRGYIKGIALMSLGTVLAQSINVLSQPIITRLVPADVLGVYSYILSLATMIIPIASLKLDMLVVSLDNDEDAQYMTDACIFIVLLISILSLIAILFIFTFYQDSVMVSYGWLVFFVPFLILTNGIRFLFISYNNRYNEYKIITYLGLIREGTRAAVQIVSGVMNLGAFGQLLGYTVGPILGLKWQTEKYISKLKGRELISIEKFKHLFLSVGKKQILYIVPAQFINTLSSTLIIMSIAELFDNTTLGYYSVGTRILDIPIIFITANVSKVVFRHVSECMEKKESTFRIVARIALYLSLISLAGFGFLYWLAPLISEVVFGHGYHIAGYYIRCICIMNGIRFVATSFAGLFTAYKKQHYELLLNVLLIVLASIAYIIAKEYGLTITEYLWCINWGYSIVYALMLTLYLGISFKRDSLMS